VIDIPEGDTLLVNFPYAYLYGSEEGYVYPEENITREQAVAVIYRLLKQDGKIDKAFSVGTYTYENIEENRWSRAALEYMKYIGVYKTSYISAQAEIPRGEVAKIICFALRIRPNDSKTINFSDLPPYNPYYHYIKALVDLGVLQGYDDGTVRPDKEMTRAEFVKMVNYMIGRKEYHEVRDELNPYRDLKKEGEKGNEIWYYNHIMRASFGYYNFMEDGIYKIDPNGKPDRYSIDYN